MTSESGAIVTVDIYQGQVVSGFVGSLGFDLAIESGGVADGTVVSSGGNEQIASGGVANGTVVSFGGYDFVAPGGVANGTIINAGGYETIASGGFANGTVVSSGGYEYIASGAIVNGIVVSSGGSIELPWSPNSANIFNGVTVQPGAIVTLDVYQGQVVSGFVCSAGINLAIEPGGVADGTVVSSGGYESVNLGGVANGTIISSGGYEYVNFGGVASGTVDRGGLELVNSGGVASGTVLNSGLEWIFSGGVTIGTIVSSGGYEQVESGGVASGTVIDSGGLAVVSAGAVVSGMVVSSGGTVDIALTSAFGLWSANAINGVTVQSGASLRLDIYQGGSISGFIAASGYSSEVYSGGIADNTIVSSGGSETVNSGGVVNGTIVSGGGLEVIWWGGVASGMVVSSGGAASLIGGTAINATIDGGQMGISDIVIGVTSTGTATGTTIDDGGIVVVQSGGVTNGTIINSGSELIYSGGVAAGTIVNSGGRQSISFNGPNVAGLSYGGGAIGTVINSGGSEQVNSGGIAIRAVVNSGGSEQVNSGGVTVSAIVSSGGTENVSPGGVASGTVIDSGGLALVGGTTSGATISSGGLMEVGQGGAAVNTTINAGGTLELFGAGTQLYVSGAPFSVSIDGSLSGTLVDNGALIFDLSSAAPHSTAITVSLSGSGSFIVEGDGTLAMSGGKAFTGDVTISGGTLELKKSVAVGSGPITFASRSGGSVETLQVDSSTMPTNVISGFAVGDRVDLAGVNFSSGGGAVLGAGNVLTVTEGGQTYTLDFDPSQNFANEAFRVSADASGGTDVFLTQVPQVVSSVYTVTSGQSVANLTVVSGGDLILAGGTALDVVVSSGGIETISSGGSDVSATVDDGSFQYVLSGGTASGTILNDPGIQIVSAGGTAIGATLSGGEQDVYGTASGTDISSGGTEYVQSGGTAVDVSFVGTGGVLKLDQPSGLGGTISNWAIGDTIDFVSASITSAGVVGNTLIITEAGNQTFSYQLANQQQATAVSLEDDGNHGTDIVLSATAPTVSVAVNDTHLNIANSATMVSFTFSTAPADFTLADVTSPDGTLSNLSGSATSYTATFTANAGIDDGLAVISVMSGSYHDGDGNAGAGGSTAPFTVDTVTPTVAVAIDQTDLNVAHNTATVTFTFSEAPAGFSLADTTAVGGTLSNLSGSGTTYTATFTAAANTAINTASVGVTAGAWQENNGNAGAGGSTAPFQVDTATPTVAVAIDNTDVDIANPTATVTFTFSAAPTSFSLADTTAAGGTLSNLSGSGTTYTATFTGAPNTDINTASVSVIAGSWQESNGNPGAGGSTALFTVDTVNALNTISSIYTVTSGQSVSNLLVVTGGDLILAGGTALDITVSSGGIETISSGGIASGTIVSSGGGEYVYSGGTDVGTTVDTAISSVVVSGNPVMVIIGAEVVSGGTAIGTTVNSGDQFVEGGGTASGTIVSSGADQSVLSGGTAVGTTLNGGLQIVYGGTAIGTTINSGGNQAVTTVSPTGQAVSGSTAIGTTINSGGRQGVGGGIAIDTIVNSGGLLFVSSAGTTISAQVIGGGAGNKAFETLSGGTASATTLTGAGVLTVFSGGLAADTIVNSTNFSTPGSNGGLFVSSGGFATGTVINSGGLEVVFNSGTDIGATVNSGGSLVVSSGGTTVSAVLQGISGTTSGVETVSSGGIAIGTTIGFGGKLVDSGGAISGTIVDAGGILTISSGGAATGTVVEGGTENIRFSGTDIGAVISGGALNVSSGGTALDATVDSGGSLIVLAGGTASGTDISGGGTEYVQSGGAAVNVSFVGTGGLLKIDQASGLGGTISNWTIGDTIDFVSASITSAGVIGNTLIITEAGNQTFSYQLANLQSGTTVRLQGDGSNGTDLILLHSTPTVSVSIDNTDVNVAHNTGTVSFTFSTAPTDFSLNDVTSPDGTLSNLSGSGTSYTATFTANAGIVDTAATVSVVGGGYHDADGTAGGGGSTAAFIVDTVPPTLTPVANQRDEATGPNGAASSFAATAIDPLDGTDPVAFKEGNNVVHSGDTFGIGTHTITASATDAHGNTASEQFTINVVDTTPPTLTPVASQTDQATSAAGAVATFAATATDLVDGTDPVVFKEGNNVVHSGDTFSLGTHTITATATDAAGNTSSEQFTINVVDTTAPTLTPVANQTDQATGPNGAVATFAATATDVVDGTDPVVFKEGNNVVHSGDTFSLGTHTITASATDAAGNTASENFTITVLNTVMPTVTSIVASPASGDKNTGAVITFTLTMSENVTVTGTPALTLNDGGMAIYQSGSGSNALIFTYTVANAQNAAALAVTGNNLNGTTVAITDTDGNAANLSGADVAIAGLAIGATVTSITANPPSGDLGPGKTVTFTVTMSEAVKLAGTTSSTRPFLTLNDGGTATYKSGSGTNVLTFTYTVGALGSGQNVSTLAVTGFNPNGATVYDSNVTADTADLSGVTSLAGGPQIDTIAPTVLSVVASGAGITNGNGDLNAGETVTLTVNFSENVTVAGGTPTLALNDGGTATYTGGSGTSALNFTYMVAAGQNTADLTVNGLALNGATIKDGAGNNAIRSGAATNPAGILQIDTTAPTIRSVVASGTGITGGAGDLDAGNTVTLTVNFSEAVTVAGVTSSTTPFLTLNDLGAATYIGGSGTTALTFAYTVAAGQNTPDLTVTGLNLNGATIEDGAGNNTVLSGAVRNPAGILKIDTTAPTVTKVVSSVTTGEVTTGHNIRITLDTSEAVNVSGAPVLLLNDGGTASYDAAHSTATALAFNYTVAAGQVTTDLVVSGIELPSASAIADLAGNNANLSGASANLGLRINTTATGSAGPSGGNFSITGSTELELFGASTANVTFAPGDTGILKLDAASQFNGTVSGLALGNELDLADIAFGANTTLGYAPNAGNTGGTLNLMDGSHTANILLLGNYMASSFVTASDGHGGTLIADPPLPPQALLAQSQHA